MTERVIDVLDNELPEIALTSIGQPNICQYCKSFDYVEWVIDD